MHRILISTVLAVALAQVPAFAHGDKAKADSAKDEKTQKKTDHKDKKGHGHDAKKH
ncbi:MAG: hypothetical protein ACT4P9_05160 [Betaproteobacteria bacterium]